ncbi:ATP-dependent Clp protease ATP-binding subunit ClpX [Myxococcota bacterium]|nr:ATP-dependent Clp protease ATP-binding subunit ClpX [Myxococcota bacterium]
MTTLKRELPRRMVPAEIKAELDRYVIGQHRAKKALAVAAYNHMKRIRARMLGAPMTGVRKSNVLMIGPTGCGKTHLARTLARFLDLPFVIADATEYTEAGYYGKDVEVMIGELLLQSDMDVSRAEQGIVFVDEVDKIARRSQWAVTGAGNRDIGGEGVQQAMLKLLEGRQVFVPTNVTQHWSKHDFVPVDTTDILFLCAGTFSDLHLYQRKRNAPGFSATDRASAPETAPVITERDLLRYGMLAEFLGRLPVRVQMGALTESELLDVLVKPPDSAIREYTELLRQDGVTLQCEDSGLRAIVQRALHHDTGARGMRTILEDVLQETLFRAPELSGKTVVLDADFVEAAIRDSGGDPGPGEEVPPPGDPVTRTPRR